MKHFVFFNEKKFKIEIFLQEKSLIIKKKKDLTLTHEDILGVRLYKAKNEI